MTDPLFDVIKVFLPALLRDVERFGVDYMAKVLVEGLRDKVHVPLSISPTQVIDEFYLWGDCVGHWGEAIGGGSLEASQTPRPRRYISHAQTHALRFQSPGLTRDHPTIQQRWVIGRTYETWNQPRMTR